MSEFFFSREAFHRSPFGAVAESAQVHFKIRLPRFLGCSAAHLVLREDAVGESRLSSLFGAAWTATSTNAGSATSPRKAPDSTGITSSWTQTAAAAGLGRVFGAHAALDAGGDWQLTCYQKDFSTPDWLSGGVLYRFSPTAFSARRRKSRPLPGHPAAGLGRRARVASDEKERSPIPTISAGI